MSRLGRSSASQILTLFVCGVLYWGAYLRWHQMGTLLPEGLLPRGWGENVDLGFPGLVEDVFFAPAKFAHQTWNTCTSSGPVLESYIPD